MAEVTNELMFELLSQRFDKVDHAILELRADSSSLRHQDHLLHGDVNSLLSSFGRMEDRIETRLELRELSESQARFEQQP